MGDLSFTVRVATPADAAGVSAVLAASYGTMLASHYDVELLDLALPLMTSANPALLGSGTYYLAENGAGEIVGAGGWSFERPGTTAIVNGLAHVRHFATLPNWAGRGIGSAILSKCIREAKSQGAEAMEAYSTLAAVGFYQTLGFIIVSLIDVPLASGITLPSMLMRLVIPSST
jgi:GNAT superfamily N-acetyltransferase